MIKVVLLGAGNVAFYLANVLTMSKKIDFIQRYSRNNINDKYFDKKIPKTNNINNLFKADIYIIAINDDAITNFSKQLIFTEGLVVHTSGSIPMNALKCKAKKGVLYPLQTFSINHKVKYNQIPICIETENKKDKELLNSLAKCLSKNVYEIISSQREKLHIAAVFANNFSNYMFKLANDICDENNISFDILKPLIEETANKIKKINPIEAQTGPAKRNDNKVIENHLSQLNENQKEIYTLVSKSIINTYN
ncbi:MAG: DUF2520 domain-containing protein [Flavobacteriaceae bacterium]|nr:DUF2520 domain-containing protein [Flavobacteriaceae bacterium]